MLIIHSTQIADILLDFFRFLAFLAQLLSIICDLRTGIVGYDF